MCSTGRKNMGNTYPQITQTCYGAHTHTHTHTYIEHHHHHQHTQTHFDRPTPTHTRPLFAGAMSHSAGNSMLSLLLPTGWLTVLTCWEREVEFSTVGKRMERDKQVKEKNKDTDLLRKERWTRSVWNKERKRKQTGWNQLCFMHLTGYSTIRKGTVKR